MKRKLQVFGGVLLLSALAGVTAYFMGDPAKKRTENDTNRFFQAAALGAPLADAVRASPNFFSVVFGSCGRLAPSPDSGPKGSLIFSPSKGEFARYSSFDEFLKLNATLFQGHEYCRYVVVTYMSIFPYQGKVGVFVDEKGVIREKSMPVFRE